MTIKYYKADKLINKSVKKGPVTWAKGISITKTDRKMVKLLI